MCISDTNVDSSRNDGGDTAAAVAAVGGGRQAPPAPRRASQKHGIYKNLGQNNCNEGQSPCFQVVPYQLNSCMQFIEIP